MVLSREFLENGFRTNAIPGAMFLSGAWRRAIEAGKEAHDGRVERGLRSPDAIAPVWAAGEK